MKEPQRDEMPTEVMDAEPAVTQTQPQLRESRPLGGESERRLLAQMRGKATPKVLVAVVVGGAVVAGAAYLVARRRPRRRWGRSNGGSPSVAGTLARSVGVWLLRAAALRLGEVLVARFSDSAPLPLASRSEVP